MKPKVFFLIHLANLQGKKLFPFPIYLYFAGIHKYDLFIEGNIPLITKRMEALQKSLDRGAQLAINEGERELFLSHTGVHREELPVNNFKEAEEKKLARLTEVVKLKQAPFSLLKELNKAILSNDFSSLIKRTLKEIKFFFTNPFVHR
ncbi:MAG: hypothetical protein WCG27_02800 [Pseudomonadota bacterium]